MIRVTSIRKCHVASYDKVYLIIRSTTSLTKTKSSILNCSTHVPDLSPSKQLFFQYLNWKRTNEWNHKVFDNYYKPAFLDELRNNANAKNWLTRIKTESDAGEKIALLCFCEDETLCHRFIIGKILRDNGCEVIFDNC